MLYLLLGFIATIFSILASQSTSDLRYKQFLSLTLCVIFIIWGFEYFNTVDYRVMLAKYNQVVFKEGWKAEDIEFGCKILFYLCSPFGNLFYYLLVAAFEVFVLSLFANKFIPRRYFWLFIVIALFNFEYTVVIMTLKRQMLATFTSLLILYVLSEKEHEWPIIKQIIVSLVICFIAFSFHKASIVSVLFVPIWFVSKYNFHRWIILGIVLLYFFQYVFDISAYSEIMFNIIASQDEKYAHYALQIEDGGRETTMIHIIIEFCSFIMMLFSLKYCSRKEKAIILSGIVYLLLINFFVQDSGRILLPFRVCQLISIPIAVSKIGNYYKMLPKIVCVVFIILSVKSTYQVYTNPDKGSMTEGFKTFNLIFEAPSLQIDNPQLESHKYLPYR